MRSPENPFLENPNQEDSVEEEEKSTTQEKFSSSLHEDPFTPETTKHLGEYKNYPERYDPSEKSVITRIEQFGIDPGVVEEEYGKKIINLTPEEYDILIGQAISKRYDTVVASVFDRYALPNPESPDSQTRWKEMMELIKRYEGMEENVGLNLIQRKADFRESGNLVLGLEAGAHLISSIADIEELKDHNVKIFGLQYGKDTPLATAGGLTEFGRKATEYLFDNDLIVDLAHSGEKTRKDVMDLAAERERGNLVAYTHGSTMDDIIESWKGKIGERALKQEEVKRLVKIGGIIGVSVSEPFFSGAEKVAERINSIAKLEHGIDRLGIGTDFGGVAPEWLKEIHNAEDLRILADMLSEEFNMDSKNINKVLRANAKEWIKKAIH
jgi:microsomal dipeptidase-like Zn-dependent dipeptidase